MLSGNRSVGAYVSGGSLVIEDSVVRDAMPEDASGSFGRGVIIQLGAETALPGTGEVRHSVIERAHDVGMFVGAAANPFADPFEIRVPRLAKKIDAGAEFIQTQCIFNLDRFEQWLDLAKDRGLLERVYILAGLTPFKSAGMAKYMKNRVPGMDVPDELVKRMSGVPKENQPEEGIKICVEAVQRLKENKFISGFHIMAIEWEEKVPEIVESAGLYPRPVVKGEG